MGNVIAIVIILLVVICCVYSIIKDKKTGKHSCGCGCGSCAMSGKCHPAKK